MKITTIAAVTAVAVAAIAIPCCEARETRRPSRTRCGNKGPFWGEGRKRVTANLPYGTVCEALWSEGTAWLECDKEVDKDASDEVFDACIDRVTGMTEAQYDFHMERNLGCGKWCFCKQAEDQEKCITDEQYAAIYKYRTRKSFRPRCDYKGPFQAGDNGETVTTNLPYGTVCEAVWSEHTAWYVCDK